MNYELTTIKDIFDKVPADRVSTCMAEITTLILGAKEKQAAVSEAAQMLGGSIRTYFPESVNWMDDGKGEVTINMDIKIENL